MFLNLVQDRYFALGQELKGAFASLLEGCADADSGERLKQRGIVVAGDDRPIAACPADMPKESMLDQMSAPSSTKDLASLAWAFTRMRSKIRREGIAGPAAALATARQGAMPSESDAEIAATIGAYDRLCLLSGAHDLCLPHSLTLATVLAHRGYAAEVVLAVQLGPFAAHCWVECQGHLVNDRFDRVRSYTPIRRL